MVWISACEQGPRKRANEWPPMMGWAQENFQENRGSFEMLESKLLASEYDEVKGGAITVGVYFGLDDSYDKEDIIDDDEEWATHLREATLFAVARLDGYTAYPTGLNPFWDEKDFQHVDGHSELFGTLTYIHSPVSDDETPLCRRDFSASRCGRCVVELAPEWYAFFTWVGGELIPETPEFDSQEDASASNSEEESALSLEMCFEEWDTLKSRASEN